MLLLALPLTAVVLPTRALWRPSRHLPVILCDPARSERDQKIDALWAAAPFIDGMDEEDSIDDLEYLTVRDELVGELDSSELLRRDEEAGIWPQDLPSSSPTAKDMLWVDEFSCIGCTWCADVARQTFKMREEYGTAMVIQQGGDPADVVKEAMDCCPKDCIIKCTREELEVLEEHRSMGFNDELLARYHFGGRLTSEGEGGKAMAIPHWKDPMIHTSWRQGDKYVKSRRLRLSDPLLHQVRGPANGGVSAVARPVQAAHTLITEGPEQKADCTRSKLRAAVAHAAGAVAEREEQGLQYKLPHLSGAQRRSVLAGIEELREALAQELHDARVAHLRPSAQETAEAQETLARLDELSSKCKA